MVNKKTLGIIAIPSIGIVLLLAVLFGFNIGGIQSTFFDDFMEEDSFDIESPVLLMNTNLCSSGQGSGLCEDETWKLAYTGNAIQTNYNNGKFTLSQREEAQTIGVFTGDISITYKPNLKNKDIKIKMTWSTNGGNGWKLLLNNQVAYQDSFAASKFDSSNSKDYLIEIYKGIENPNEHFILVNGAEVNSVVIDDALLQVGFSLTPLSQITLDYIRSKDYFNCEVEADEIVIRDEFTEGSTLDINDLTYPPVKFCLTSYPVIVRSFTEEGIRADIRGELTQKLAAGETITVPADATYQIHYIADYQEGQTLRCPIDSAWDTRKNVCVKIIEEAEDIIELVRDTQFITVGKNQLFFQNTLEIGDLTLSSSMPTYGLEQSEDLCTIDESHNAPDPETKCWKTTVSFDGNSYEMFYNDEVDLNEYLSLKYTPTARYDQVDGVEKWTNNFVLTFKNFDFITVQAIDNKYYRKLNSEETIKFQLNNKLANFEESGFRVLKTTDLITEQTSFLTQTSIPLGDKTLELDLDTDRLGEVFYVLTPYIEVNNEKFFIDKQIIYNFFISQTGEEEEPTVTTPVGAITTAVPRGDDTILGLPSLFVYVGGAGLGIFIVIVISGLIFRRRGGKKRKKK